MDFVEMFDGHHAKDDEGHFKNIDENAPLLSF